MFSFLPMGIGLKGLSQASLLRLLDYYFLGLLQGKDITHCGGFVGALGGLTTLLTKWGVELD